MYVRVSFLFRYWTRLYRYSQRSHLIGWVMSDFYLYLCVSAYASLKYDNMFFIVCRISPLTFWDDHNMKTPQAWPGIFAMRLIIKHLPPNVLHKINLKMAYCLIIKIEYLPFYIKKLQKPPPCLVVNHWLPWHGSNDSVLLALAALDINQNLTQEQWTTLGNGGNVHELWIWVGQRRLNTRLYIYCFL